MIFSLWKPESSDGIAMRVDGVGEGGGILCSLFDW